MLLDLQRDGKTVLDRIAQPAQQADARIACVGEDRLLGHPHADHLVVYQIGCHPDERERFEPLAYRLVRGGRWYEMREPFEGHRVAIIEIGSHGGGERHELPWQAGIRRLRRSSELLR